MTLRPCSLAKPNSQCWVQTFYHIAQGKRPSREPRKQEGLRSLGPAAFAPGTPYCPSTTGTKPHLSTPLAWPPGGWGTTPLSDSSITSPQAPRSAFPQYPPPGVALASTVPGPLLTSRLQTPCLGSSPSSPPSSPSGCLALALPGCLSPYLSPSISVSSPGRLSAADASPEWRC